MLDSREKLSSRLVAAGCRYLELGWSVLPVRGDADPLNPKAPALPWRSLQQRSAAAADLPGWFDSGNAAGLGIVCGRVSRLAVLDVDDEAAARAFAASCPQLLDTWTVRSGGRRQPHYYFVVPDDVTLRGGRAPGVDLQFEGAYVIAPPTSTGGARWDVVNEVAPLELDQVRADALQKFLAFWRLRAGGGAMRLPGGESPGPPLPADDLKAASLRGWYRKLVAAGGRNRALFRSACLARDCGWSQREALAVLAPAHVLQAAVGEHAAETPAQRSREARRTIDSAWRRPRRRALRLGKRRGLPNAVRESLLAQGKVAPARVLDALLLAGVHAGRLLSERMICCLLGGLGIGRRCVRQALSSRLPDGELVFVSPRNPPDQRAVAARKWHLQSLQCESVRGAGRVKSGRPARWYRVPSSSFLLRRLGLRDRGSDLLAGRDLHSPQAYRCALHRSLIERRPGLYSRCWLGARLGVSVWTSRRYDRRSGLRVQARYRERQLDQGLLDRLPVEKGIGGCFLASADGRRWPALREVARGLLERYGHLRYLRQGWNHYELTVATVPTSPGRNLQGMPSRVHQGSVTGVTVGPGRSAIRPLCENSHKPPVGTLAQSDGRVAVGPLPEPPGAALYWRCAACERGGFREKAPLKCPACGQAAVEAVAPEVWRDPGRCSAWWRERRGADGAREAGATSQPAGPAANVGAAELALARQLCRATRSRGARHALSLASARRLLQINGIEACRRVLRILEQRRNIRNPGGFVVALLGGKRGSEVGQRRSQEEWLAALRASPMVDVIEC